MTTPQLLQQAKQGNPTAIAQLMNHSLKPKGIEATVSRQGDRLRVLLVSANTINQPVLTQFVQNGIQNLNISDIKTVELLGQPQSNPDQAWSQVVTLDPIASPPNRLPTPPPVPPPVSDVSPPPATSPSTTVIQPPIVSEPIASASAPIPDDELDESSEANDFLVDDLSLDEELSMATIDQIVADAVKEVTTQIQNEMPFELEDSTTDQMQTPSVTSDPTTVSGAGVDPLDAALEQAVQTGELDDLLSQDFNLDLTDTVTDAESDETRPPRLPNLIPLAQNPDSSDVNVTQPIAAPSDAEFDAEFDASDTFDRAVFPLSSSSSLKKDDNVTEFQQIPLEAMSDAESSGAESDDEVDHNDSSDRDSDNDGSAKNEGEDSDQFTDDKPASRILFAIVSALTFGSIVGLVGYSIHAYQGDWYQVVVGEQEDGQSELDPDVGDEADTSGGDPEADVADGVDGETDVAAATADSENESADSPPAADDSASGDTEVAAPDSPDDTDSDTPADFPVTPPENDSANDNAAEGGDAGDADATDAASTAASTALQPPDVAIANCPAIATSPAQTLTLSQIQLDPEIPPANGVYTITGCLTNHTDGTIVAATLDYEGRSSADAAAQGSMYFNAPAPKATVPFRTRLALSDDANTIQVNGLIWNLDGEAAQTLPLEFALPLSDN